MASDTKKVRYDALIAHEGANRENGNFRTLSALSVRLRS